MPVQGGGRGERNVVSERHADEYPVTYVRSGGIRIDQLVYLVVLLAAGGALLQWYLSQDGKPNCADYLRNFQTPPATMHCDPPRYATPMASAVAGLPTVPAATFAWGPTQTPEPTNTPAPTNTPLPTATPTPFPALTAADVINNAGIDDADIAPVEEKVIVSSDVTARHGSDPEDRSGAIQQVLEGLTDPINQVYASIVARDPRFSGVDATKQYAAQYSTKGLRITAAMGNTSMGPNPLGLDVMIDTGITASIPGLQNVSDGLKRPAYSGLYGFDQVFQSELVAAAGNANKVGALDRLCNSATGETDPRDLAKDKLRLEIENAVTAALRSKGIDPGSLAITYRYPDPKLLEPQGDCSDANVAAATNELNSHVSNLLAVIIHWHDIDKLWIDEIGGDYTYPAISALMVRSSLVEPVNGAYRNGDTRVIVNQTQKSFPPK